MGHIWRQPPSEERYERLELSPAGLSLLSMKRGQLDVVEGARAKALATLLPLGREAVLLAGADARILVNGEPVLGVTVLEERDEVLLDGESLFFGAGNAAAPRAFAAEDGAQRCGRCHRVLHPGDEVVECGRCSGLHHEGRPAAEEEALLCWSHAPVCGVCQHDRSGWTPGGPGDA
jgi:hypothetical protein